MKLTDMIISGLIKRGIVYEARNVNVDFTIPRTKMEQVGFDLDGIKINFKADHVTLKIDKEDS